MSGWCLTDRTKGIPLAACIIKGLAAQIHVCELSFPSCTSTKWKCCEFQYHCLQESMWLHCDFSGPQHPDRSRDPLGLHTGPATTGNCQKGEKMTLHRKTVQQYGLTLWQVFSNSVLIVLVSLIRSKVYVTWKTRSYSIPLTLINLKESDKIMETPQYDIILFNSTTNSIVKNGSFGTLDHPPTQNSATTKTQNICI